MRSASFFSYRFVLLIDALHEQIESNQIFDLISSSLCFLERSKSSSFFFSLNCNELLSKNSKKPRFLDDTVQFDSYKTVFTVVRTVFFVVPSKILLSQNDEFNLSIFVDGVLMSIDSLIFMRKMKRETYFVFCKEKHDQGLQIAECFLKR